MIAPAGAAAVMARPNTKMVLSSKLLTSTCPIWGRRKGGNSSTKAEGIPRSTVRLRKKETSNVMPTESPMTTKRVIPDIHGLPADKNTAVSSKIVGNRPLQGTKLLVNMAMSLSLGESMMRHAVTPAALQPKPIQSVSACFPCAPARRNSPSNWNAILGSRPQSSSRVNMGKKMAIGGSITETTQLTVKNTPSMSRLSSQTGLPQDTNTLRHSVPNWVKTDMSH